MYVLKRDPIVSIDLQLTFSFSIQYSSKIDILMVVECSSIIYFISFLLLDIQFVVTIINNVILNILLKNTYAYSITIKEERELHIEIL